MNMFIVFYFYLIQIVFFFSRLVGCLRSTVDRKSSVFKWCCLWKQLIYKRLEISSRTRPFYLSHSIWYNADSMPLNRVCKKMSLKYLFLFNFRYEWSWKRETIWLARVSHCIILVNKPWKVIPRLFFFVTSVQQIVLFRCQVCSQRLSYIDAKYGWQISNNMAG